MTDNKILGSCHCDKVEFHIANAIEQVQTCHSAESQKLSGSAFRTNVYVTPDNFRWVKGSGFVKRYRDRHSNASKAFCMECGASMPLEDSAGAYVRVPAGALDSTWFEALIPEQTPPQQIFWHERAQWFDHTYTAKSSVDSHEEDSESVQIPFK